MVIFMRNELEEALSALEEKISDAQETFRGTFGAVRVDVGFEIDPRIPKQGCYIRTPPRENTEATLSWGRTKDKGWGILLSTKTLGDHPIYLGKCPPRYRVAGAAEIPRLAETLRRECTKRLERIREAVGVLDALIEEHGE